MRSVTLLLIGNVRWSTVLFHPMSHCSPLQLVWRGPTKAMQGNCSSLSCVIVCSVCFCKGYRGCGLSVMKQSNRSAVKRSTSHFWETKVRVPPREITSRVGGIMGTCRKFFRGGGGGGGGGEEFSSVFTFLPHLPLTVFTLSTSPSSPIYLPSLFFTGNHPFCSCLRVSLSGSVGNVGLENVGGRCTGGKCGSYKHWRSLEIT